ncbi:PAS domain-containing protein [Spirosoma sp. RP8]|uniref:histidine kinase n=1 Tax=Spirosoma liriopis TaxID=2937440 RepID=A0ABT0HSM5_9BACT|nr:PAS domain-containing protein [Spirosoma liriopis]MCK8495178.1 PAS domain-containing protein [Spirosoma liriopis]
MMPDSLPGTYPFLARGGEMGALIRAFDWSATVLDTPDHWPQSLRTTVTTLLNSEFPMFLWWGPELIQFYNDAYRLLLTNSDKYSTALGQSGQESWANNWSFVKPLLDRVRNGESIRVDDGVIPSFCTNGPDTIYGTSSYSPVYDDAGAVAGVLLIAHDTTSLKKNEAVFRNLIEEAPVATCLFVGRDLRIEVANEPMLNFWGKGRSVFGKPVAEAVPELQGQPFLATLAEVFETGKTYEAKASPAWLAVNGVLGTYYFDFTYKPLRDANGDVYAIMEMAVDVTAQVLASQQLIESEQFTRNVFYNSPVAKIVFVGEDMTIRTINENMLTMIGRNESVVGKPLLEAVPELVVTPLMERLKRVLATGETYRNPGEKVNLVRYGQPYVGYYNYVYKALHNAQGKRYGVMVTATEVTEQVLARLAVEESESRLRGAIELAQLGTWEMDIATGSVTYSDRIKSWFGVDGLKIDVSASFNPIHPEDSPRIEAAIQTALQPGSSGVYDEEYRLINYQTGDVRIVHAQGRVLYDTQGQAYKLVGTAQDVTAERQQQFALAQLVQERTEELAAANEELAATNEELYSANEEYAAINEELEESNGLLFRSNENLQQFAYVASHDLQEPLRKIQQFGDLLKNHLGDQLGEGSMYLDRMQAAASRMSTLIKDLLSFSRLSTQRNTVDSVSLTEVVETVLADLELVIAESKAVLQLDILPAVEGDRSQLEQLFQNLLSNALKFHKPGMAPHIQVRAGLVTFDQLPSGIKPSRMAASYHRIEVADNGVGFDEKYLDRIFQVFQRLHGKSEFSGTGIGLAICEKVVTNHGGAITATSHPGQGATFIIYLPV